MTFAELKTETFRRLEESSGSPVFFSEADIEEALNEAYQEISDATEWREVWRTIDLCAARPYYDVRTIFQGVTILTPGAAFHEDTNRWLMPSSARDLDRGYPRWEQVVGQPDRVQTRGLFWLGYWPLTASEAGTVKQFATALPDALEDDTDEPGFAEVYHEGLVDYAVAELLPQAGEVTKALGFWQSYLAIEAGLAAQVEGRGSVPRVNRYDPS